MQNAYKKLSFGKRVSFAVQYHRLSAPSPPLPITACRCARRPMIRGQRDFLFMCGSNMRRLAALPHDCFRLTMFSPMFTDDPNGHAVAAFCCGLDKCAIYTGDNVSAQRLQLELNYLHVNIYAMSQPNMLQIEIADHQQLLKCARMHET